MTLILISRTELQKPDFDDGQLLEILRGKDVQIVELENQTRELTKECDMKEQQLQKLLEELKTYKDFLEVSAAAVVVVVVAVIDVDVVIVDVLMMFLLALLLMILLMMYLLLSLFLMMLTLILIISLSFIMLLSVMTLLILKQNILQKSFCLIRSMNYGPTNR